MALCAEGGEGADIKYISPKDNRGAESWVGHKLDDYANGTKVEFIVK
ncbi:competence protein [Paenibacillus polymyxa]|uniref:DNA-entry nuclease n=1 Tax=Paenibacillus polymyxa TaxID=1406 RepID=A0A378Y0G9_PAEPO|nr:competence protein [Paenibacillus polymyxa]SUA70010.1 DNA-entry nuclease [Paenibacillus polymyxa]